MAENLESTDVFLWDLEECFVRAIYKGLGRASQGMRLLGVCHSRMLSKKNQPGIRRDKLMLRVQPAAVFIKIRVSVTLIPSNEMGRILFNTYCTNPRPG